MQVQPGDPGPVGEPVDRRDPAVDDREGEHRHRHAVLGARDARKGGESEERVFAVAAWRETPYFSEAEGATTLHASHRLAGLA